MAKLVIKTRGQYNIPVGEVVSSNLELLKYLADIVNGDDRFCAEEPIPDGNDIAKPLYRK